MTSNNTSLSTEQLATVADIQAKEAGLDDGDNMLPEEVKKEKRRQRSQLLYGQGGIIDGVSSLIDRDTAEGGLKVVEGKGYAVGTIRVRTKKELFRQKHVPGPLCRKLDYPSYQRGVKVVKLKKYNPTFFEEQVMTGQATVKEVEGWASEIVAREEEPVKFAMDELKRGGEFDHATRDEVVDELTSTLGRHLTKEERTYVKKRLESDAWTSKKKPSNEVMASIATYVVQLANEICPGRNIQLGDLMSDEKREVVMEKVKRMGEENKVLREEINALKQNVSREEVNKRMKM